jgi:hypothetical protein
LPNMLFISRFAAQNSKINPSKKWPFGQFFKKLIFQLWQANSLFWIQ